MDVSPESPRYVVLRFAQVGKQGGAPYWSLVVVDIERSRIAWQRTDIPGKPKIWNQTLFIPGEGRECLDLVSGRSVRDKYADAVVGLILEHAVLSSRKRPDEAYLVPKSPRAPRDMTREDPRWDAIHAGKAENVYHITAGEKIEARPVEQISVLGWLDMDSFDGASRWRYPYSDSQCPQGTPYLIWDAKAQVHRKMIPPPEMPRDDGTYVVLLGEYLWTRSGTQAGLGPQRHTLMDLQGRRVNTMVHGYACGNVILPDCRAVSIYPDAESGTGLRIPKENTNRIDCINLLAGAGLAPVSELAARMRRAECLMALKRCGDVIKETDRLLAGRANLPEALWLKGLAHEQLGQLLLAFNAFFDCGYFSGDEGLRARAHQKLHKILPAYMRLSADDLQVSDLNPYGVPTDRMYSHMCVDVTVGAFLQKEMGLIPNEYLVPVKAWRGDSCQAYLNLKGRQLAWSFSIENARGVCSGDPRGYVLLDIGDRGIRICDPIQREETTVTHEVSAASVPLGFPALLRSLNKAMHRDIVLWAEKIEKEDREKFMTGMAATDLFTGRRLWEKDCRCRLSDSGTAGFRNLIVDDFVVLGERRHDTGQAGLCSYRLKDGELCGAWWTDPEDRLGGRMPMEKRSCSVWNGWLLLPDYGYGRDGLIPYFDPATGERGGIPHKYWDRLCFAVLAKEERKYAIADPSITKGKPQQQREVTRTWLGESGASPRIQDGILFAADGKRVGILPDRIGDTKIFARQFGTRVMQDLYVTKNFVILAPVASNPSRNPDFRKDQPDYVVVYEKGRFYALLGLNEKGFPLEPGADRLEVDH